MSLIFFVEKIVLPKNEPSEATIFGLVWSGMTSHTQNSFLLGCFPPDY